MTLEELEAICNAASSGPWTAQITKGSDGCNDVADSKFIKCARDYLPALVSEVRKLRQEALRKKIGISMNQTLEYIRKEEAARIAEELKKIRVESYSRLDKLEDGDDGWDWAWETDGKVEDLEDELRKGGL
jgi:hypothetical protein